MKTTNSIRAVAFKLTYPKGWRLGRNPDRQELGELTLPITASVEDCDQALQKAFPDATDSRLYDQYGLFFCGGTIR